jgi:hypothetical protein
MNKFLSLYFIRRPTFCRVSECSPENGSNLVKHVRAGGGRAGIYLLPVLRRSTLLSIQRFRILFVAFVRRPRPRRRPYSAFTVR